MLRPAAGCNSSLSARPPERLPTAQHDAEQFARLQRLQFESLARHAVKLPVLILLVAALVGFIAWDSAPRALIVGWVAALVFIPLVRWRYSSRALERTNLDLKAGLRTMTVLSFANGVVQGAGIALFFPGLGLEQKAIVTMIMVCLSAGAVSANAGYSRSFYAWAAPMFVALGLAWGLQGDFTGTWIGLLLMLFPVAQAVFVRDNERVLRESFEIRYQNERLIRELELQREAVARERDRAEEANRAKSRFLASASHDLRQPLHTLSLYSAALGMRKNDARTQEMALEISNAIAWLGSLLDALLDISKLDAEAVRPESTRFALGPLLVRIAADFRAAAAVKGVALELDATEPAHVETDAVLLERVLRNLVDNAVKYTARGSVTIELSAQANRAVVTVADTGPGIPREEHERVFEEFYQLSNPERDHSRGIGLGLAIVKRLANLLRIELALDSEPGRGTSFTLALPLADGRPAYDAGAQSRPAAGPVALPEGLRVLVVDDEGWVRRGMQALLESWGCEVTLASGMAEALAALARGQPDLIIADQRLRGAETGIEFVRHARSRVGQIPALLITGDTAAEIFMRAERLGITVLHKPVAEAVLRSAIARAVPLGVR
jgi:signal transduction histidine kinase/CheY-like chemotaxis protein